MLVTWSQINYFSPQSSSATCTENARVISIEPLLINNRHDETKQAGRENSEDVAAKKVLSGNKIIKLFLSKREPVKMHKTSEKLCSSRKISKSNLHKYEGFSSTVVWNSPEQMLQLMIH